MTPASFSFLAALLHGKSGYVLQAEKTYLVESRLAPLVEARGLGGLDELVAVLSTGREPALADDVVELMTINETSFFRDKSPFHTLINDVLPALAGNRRPDTPIRIWSAACSIGQEPYSIAMAIKEATGVIGRRRVEILATDISRRNIERGRSGIYSDHEIQRGLPEDLRERYFHRRDSAWEASARLRGMIRFEAFNLLDDCSRRGVFDVIFCRNVLIYMDAGTKCRVLCSLGQQLARDGALFMGAAETVVGVCKSFQPAPGLRGAAALAGTPAPVI